MSEHETFHFLSLDDFRQRIGQLGLDIELSEDFSPLFESVPVGNHQLANRMVVLPMEGCDGTADGAPGELTFRRYRRFAAGGAGLLWFEATAVVHEGRANPRQLWLNRKTLPAFTALVEQSLKAGRETMGESHRPLTIVQLTHSGRYSRPGRSAAPIIAHHSPFLDPTHKLPPDYPLITDDELERLEDAYVEAARCAQEAGFDGVDIKACHRYLISELHASFTRRDSRYGGPSFENRSRFFRNIVTKIRQAVPDLMVTSRMNVFDAMPHPYGFGMDANDPAKPDLAEPLELARFLRDQETPLVNITIGNPYYNPHVNRPFDLPTAGAPTPSEHPLLGVDRFIHIVRQIQTSIPEMAVIGGGYSWLRQFLPHVAAANIRKGWVSLIGLGRMAFAYPDCVRELKATGQFNPEKVCVACSACTQIMRDGGRSGCVPRDAEVYESIYKQGRADALDTIKQMAATCRQCNDPACVRECPAQVNIPRFVGHIVEGRFQEAYKTLREANVLAAVCGYVCPAEVQCEGACINQRYSFPVPIRHLQRWVSHKAVEEGWAAETSPEVPATSKKVAIIGAGPAGIAAATRLAALGHAVTLFEKANVPGGAAQEVIPLDRLPNGVLQKEIQSVLASHAHFIERRHESLNGNRNLDQLQAEGYDAILLTVGLSKSVPLPGSIHPQKGVLGALEFLARAKKGEKLSGTVLVLGGGNTALDAALTALRSGATDVSIVYRRSFAEMPAWPEERNQAISAGINFLTLTAPIGYVADAEGRLSGLKVQRTKLGAPDRHGRRRPEAIADTDHVLPTDWVLEAIGQQIDEDLKAALPGIRFTDEGLIWVHDDRLETSREGVFAAGDVVNGGTTVVRAVAEGTRVAQQIDTFLQAEPIPLNIKN